MFNKFRARRGRVDRGLFFLGRVKAVLGLLDRWDRSEKEKGVVAIERRRPSHQKAGASAVSVIGEDDDEG